MYDICTVSHLIERCAFFHLSIVGNFDSVTYQLLKAVFLTTCLLLESVNGEKLCFLLHVLQINAVYLSTVRLVSAVYLITFYLVKVAYDSTCQLVERCLFSNCLFVDTVY